MKLLFKILQRIVIGLLAFPAMVLNVVVIVVSMTVGVVIAIPIVIALSIPCGLEQYLDFVVERVLPSAWLDAWAKRVNK